MARFGSPERFDRRTFLRGGLALGGTLAGLDLADLSRAAALAAAAGPPKRGGTLVAAQEVDPVSLDPHTNSNFSALQGYEHIYESLTGYDEKTNVVPALAEKWDVSDGGKNYTFHLRPGAKVQNGRPVTAADCVYTMNRALNPRTRSEVASTYLNDIVGAADVLQGRAAGASAAASAARAGPAAGRTDRRRTGAAGRPDREDRLQNRSATLSPYRRRGR